MDLTHLLSPSKARIHLAQSKDWSYITAWLATKYSPSSPPPFERNDETLNTLLALAALNESADEEKEIITNFQHDALGALEADAKQDPDAEILSAVEGSLTREGRTSLDILASVSVALGGPAKGTSMAGKIIELTTEEFDSQQQVQRVEALQKQLGRELSLLQEQLDDVRGEAYQAPADLPQKTSSWIHSTKVLNAKVADYKEKISALEKGKPPAINIPQLVKEERDVLEMKEKVRALEGRVSMFEGLPPDTDLAKSETERLRRELIRLERKRDDLFEGLVEATG